MSDIKIYKEIGVGLVFFEGSNVSPQPVNKLQITAHPSRPNRIVITRTDRFRRDGVTPLKKFSKLLYTRIRDKDGNSFASRADAITYLEAIVVQDATDTDAEYQGIWTPSTNTPDIFTDTTGYVAGDFYRITAAGTHNSIDYNAGDVVMFNSAVKQKGELKSHDYWYSPQNKRYGADFNKDTDVFQLDPSSIRINLGTFINPKKMYGTHFVKQFLGNLKWLI